MVVKTTEMSMMTASVSANQNNVHGPKCSAVPSALGPAKGPRAFDSG